MGQERRFGKRIAEPSSVQIIHELKLMALRQSLDKAISREAAETPSTFLAGQPHHQVRVRDAAPSDFA